MVTKRSARRDRTATINQIRALVSTAPDDIRSRFAHHTTLSLVAETAALPPRPGEIVEFTTRVALRELGRRAVCLAEEIDRVDELLIPLVAARAPRLLAVAGVGPDTAANLLIAAGDHPERLRSEAAWAHFCGTAPIPASSGKITRLTASTHRATGSPRSMRCFQPGSDHSHPSRSGSCITRTLRT
jgi:transposase